MVKHATNLYYYSIWVANVILVLESLSFFTREHEPCKNTLTNLWNGIHTKLLFLPQRFALVAAELPLKVYSLSYIPQNFIRKGN